MLPTLDIQKLAADEAGGLRQYLDQAPSNLDELLEMYNFLRDSTLEYREEYYTNPELSTQYKVVLNAFIIFEQYLKSNPKGGEKTYYDTLIDKNKIDNKHIDSDPDYKSIQPFVVEKYMSERPHRASLQEEIKALALNGVSSEKRYKLIDILTEWLNTIFEDFKIFKKFLNENPSDTPSYYDKAQVIEPQQPVDLLRILDKWIVTTPSNVDELSKMYDFLYTQYIKFERTPYVQIIFNAFEKFRKYLMDVWLATKPNNLDELLKMYNSLRDIYLESKKKNKSNNELIFDDFKTFKKYLNDNPKSYYDQLKEKNQSDGIDKKGIHTGIRRLFTPIREERAQQEEEEEGGGG